MRRLEGPEIGNYDVIDRDLAARVRIVQWPLLPPGAAGMTIGRFVFVRRDDDRSGDRELLAHELVHVGQYARYGLVGFLTRYVGQYVSALRHHRRHRAAYLAMPFEQEARRVAKQWHDRRPKSPSNTRRM